MLLDKGEEPNCRLLKKLEVMLKFYFLIKCNMLYLNRDFVTFLSPNFRCLFLVAIPQGSGEVFPLGAEFLQTQTELLVNFIHASLQALTNTMLPLC
jgi:hypothetical protein